MFVRLMSLPVKFLHLQVWMNFHSEPAIFLAQATFRGQKRSMKMAHLNPKIKALYEGEGISPEKEIISYCRIGERSAHSWFVLNELLDYPNVRNYDGSWTEWGNLIDAPIER